MRWTKAAAAATLLLGAAACSRGAATTSAPPVTPPASNTATPSTPKGSYAPSVDFSSIDHEMNGLNSDLTGADQSLNTSQEGDVSQ